MPERSEDARVARFARSNFSFLYFSFYFLFLFIIILFFFYFYYCARFARLATRGLARPGDQAKTWSNGLKFFLARFGNS